MREIRVGLAGFGIGGSLFHAPFIASTNGLRLTAVATARAEEEVERSYPGVVVRPGWQELVGDPSIDLIVVSTPTSTHFEIACAAIGAGKHVVLDKPMAVATEQGRELVRKAFERGVVLTVYQNRRWDGDFRTVRRVIEQGRVGTVYLYEAQFDRFRTAVKPGWRETDEQASGILYDLGAHLIDQAIVLFGVARAVSADVLAQRPEARAVDYFHLRLDYGRLRVNLRASSLVREPGPRFSVHGDGGSFLKYGIDPQEDALRAGKRPGTPDWGRENPEQYGLLVKTDAQPATVETLPGDYGAFYRGLAACLREGGPVPVNPEDSVRGIQLIEAAKESARRGCVIRLV